MKNHLHLALTVAGVALVATDARGAFITLFDYAYNVDGFLTTGPGRPAGVNDAAFDYATGLGTISFSIATPGSHFLGLFLDHEIDETINTFFNEFGTAVGTAPAGLSWEIDEPGFLFGDIHTRFEDSDPDASELDNSSGVPQGSPEDVSMALGWNFVLSAGENSTVSFHVATQAPASGFYLTQTDPQSNASVFFSSTRSAAAVPEAGPTGALLGLGCLAVFGADMARRRLRRCRSAMH